MVYAMNLISNITFFLFILFSYVLQNLMIYPIESAIRADAHSEIVSLLYLPHGMKILFAFMLGPSSVIYIFLAQYISFGWFFEFSVTNLIGSILGSFSIILPVILLNLSSKKPILEAPVNYQIVKLNIIWTFTSLSLFTALIDSTLHMKLYYDVAEIDVFTYFIVGDFMGAMAVFLLFLFVYRPLMNKFLLQR